MDLKLGGKCALVSGSNRGTGKLIAEGLEKEGASVVYHANRKEDYDSLVASNPEKKMSMLWGDLGQQPGRDQVLEQIREKQLQIDILVNNYGTASGGKWDTFDENAWLEIYQKNVLSSAQLGAALIPGMKQRGWGRVLQLSTIGSISPNAIMPHYYASKGALANTTVSMAKELTDSGVTVNTISPGLILTDELKAAYMVRAGKKGWGEEWPEIETALVKHDFPNLCGRIARPEEVADLVCFLASEKAAYINAQNIRIDGGSLALTI